MYCFSNVNPEWVFLSPSLALTNGIPPWSSANFLATVSSREGPITQSLRFIDFNHSGRLGEAQEKCSVYIMGARKRFESRTKPLLSASFFLKISADATGGRERDSLWGLSLVSSPPLACVLVSPLVSPPFGVSLGCALVSPLVSPSIFWPLPATVSSPSLPRSTLEMEVVSLPWSLPQSPLSNGSSLSLGVSLPLVVTLDIGELIMHTSSPNGEVFKGKYNGRLWSSRSSL